MPLDPAPPEPVDRPARAVADPSRLRAVAVLLAAALLTALVWWWTGRPEDRSEVVSRIPADPVVPAAVSPSAATAPASVSAFPSAAPELVVDVRGAVRHPGVRRLPSGSRVLDAIEAAGGLRDGGHYGAVNLARPLVDGEQVVVGPVSGLGGQVPSVGSTAAGVSPGTPGAVLDLNTATQEQLEGLTGVGPVLAGEIVAWRTEHGRFTSVDDLLDVSGIGEKTLEGLRDQVRAG